MTNNSSITRIILIIIALIFGGIFLFLPVVVIFVEALSQGVKFYLNSITDQDAIIAIKLSILISLIAVPINLIFAICAAWCITKFDFTGKNILITLIDLPFSVSPIISGLIFVLIFGTNQLIGKWLANHNIYIIFALPSLIIVTLFITLPLIIKQLIPLMQRQGNQNEEAAISLGATGWITFWRVTLPNIKWGILHGTLLANARAMGEFGAVSVVSGHIRGATNTVPLHIEILYNEYNFVASFAVATILTILSLITLLIKAIIEYKYKI